MKICFVTVCYRSFRLQVTVSKHLIGLAVIVANFITTFLKQAYACQCLINRPTILLDFLVTVKAAPHECVIRTGQP